MALGELEQVVLFALVRLGGESHGAPIIELIDTQLRRQVSPGALYTVLDRLERKGFVESWIGESTPKRGGRRRKVYRILPLGARELRDWYGGIRSLAADVLPVLEHLAEGAG